MYANIDGFDYGGAPVPLADRNEIDRWVISRLNTTIKLVDEYLEQYEPTRAIRYIEEFIEDLSNWYVRRSRSRFWGEGSKTEITSAYQTLFECLLAVSKLISPFAPYLGEWIYQQLSTVVPQEEESVHLSFFPSVEETAINKKLEHQMDLARQISSLVLKSRNQVGINVRQPLAEIILPILSEEERQNIESVRYIILDEVNVKDIRFVDDDTDIIHKAAVPNFKILGKKLGKYMKEVAAFVKNLSNDEINALDKTGAISFTAGDGTSFSLNKEEIVVKSTGLHGWSVESEQGLTVALNTTLTDELAKEGIAREFVNRVQNMRKEADFDVQDRIEVSYEASEELSLAIEELREYICGQTLTDTLSQGELAESDFVKEWTINDVDCTIYVKKNL